MAPPLKYAEYLAHARELEATPGVNWGKLGILSSFSAELLRHALIVESYRVGTPLLPWFAPFNQFEQLLADPRSALWQEKPDVIWIALRLEDEFRYVVEEHSRLGAGTVSDRLSELRRRIVALAETAVRAGSVVLVSNLAVPWLTNSLFDASDPDGVVHLVAAENRRLAQELVALKNAHVFDYAGVVTAVGRERFFDARLYYLARAACSQAAQQPLAAALARTAAALLRPAAKCLVLDLDNTLWGGVLGDDGAGAIQIGDDYPGNMFKDFQAVLLGYRSRGFLLAIASKNDDQTVRSALASHPELLLRTEHFACIEASWEPKPTSLRKIAETLNIGLESLLFFDDNPVERAEVRAALPQVSAVELPHDPAAYLAALSELALLDRPRVLSEDRARAEMYEQESMRRQIQVVSGNVADFLVSLKMAATIGLSDSRSLDRIHQLIQKTNQFNLTTRRHSMSQLEALAASKEARVAWLRLTDRFGELGLVCVGILRQADAEVWEIDTFLMSCRVMGRHVEDAFLCYLAELAQEAGARRLRGEYRPTAKNTPVRTFFSDREFRQIEASEGTMLYEKEVAIIAAHWPSVIQRNTDGTAHGQR